MKALLLHTYGPSSSSLRIEETKKPRCKKNQLLIKISAAAINPVDYKMVKGNYKIVQRFKFPVKIGYDFCGEIIEKGSDISKFKVGDLVYGCLSANQMGSFAEFCLAEEDNCCLKPNQGSMVDNAAMPLAGMTVLQAMDKAGLSKGHKLLIHAGSGGVGTLAIQYAKHIGAQVYTTTSSKNAEWVEKLGADRVIAYDKENYLEHCNDIDIVFDTLGGKYSREAIKVLKEGGVLVNIAGGIDHKAAKDLGVPGIFRFLLYLKRLPLNLMLKKKKITYNYVLMKSNASDLNRLKLLIESEKLKAVIDSVHRLEDFKTAFKILESNRAKGKIVFDLS